MRNPELFTVNQLKNWNTDVEFHTGIWVPARPTSDGSGFRFWRNLKMAIGVFIGKFDAVEWYKQ